MQTTYKFFSQYKVKKTKYGGFKSHATHLNNRFRIGTDVYIVHDGR